MLPSDSDNDNDDNDNEKGFPLSLKFERRNSKIASGSPENRLLSNPQVKTSLWCIDWSYKCILRSAKIFDIIVFVIPV